MGLFSRDEDNNYGSDHSGLFNLFSDNTALRLQMAGSILSSLAYGQNPNMAGVLAQAQQIADSRNQKKKLYSAATRYADKIRPSNPDLADAILADPSLISTIMGEKIKEESSPDRQFYNSLMGANNGMPKSYTPNTPTTPTSGMNPDLKARISNAAGMTDLTDNEAQRLALAATGGPEKFAIVMGQIQDDRRQQLSIDSSIKSKAKEQAFAENIAKQLEDAGNQQLADAVRMDPQLAREVMKQQVEDANGSSSYNQVFGAPPKGDGLAAPTQTPPLDPASSAAPAGPGAASPGAMPGGSVYTSPPPVPPPSGQTPVPVGQTTTTPGTPMVEPPQDDHLKRAGDALGIPDITEDEYNRVKIAGPKKMQETVSQIMDDRRLNKTQQATVDNNKVVNAMRMYDDFQQRTKAYRSTIDVASRVDDLSNSKDPVEQMEVLYSYIKALDDTAVKEGEVALARETSSYTQLMELYMQKVSQGQLAADTVVSEMKKRVKRLGILAQKKMVKQQDDFKKRARAMSIPEGYIFSEDYTVDEQPPEDRPALVVPNFGEE